MNTNANPTMYEAIPTVSNLNRVPGFDPLKFLRKTDDGPKLDLKYKKLWFRLKHPSGRTKLTALRVTDQLAIIEAKVYFDKNDPNPNGNYIVTKYAQSTPGGLYIEAAQHDAMDAALNDAGFGVQFLPVEPKGATEAMRPIVAEKESSDAPVVEANIPAESLPAVNKDAPSVVKSTTATEEPISAPAIAVEEVPVHTVQNADSAVTTETGPAKMTEAPSPHIEDNTPAGQNEISVSATTQAPAQAEAMAVEAAPSITLESFTAPDISADTSAEAPAPFTPNMPVDDICAIMTLEEAGNMIVPVGTCKGWTLSQVADRRPASLKWYLNGYNGEDNSLRAGAKLMLEAIASMDKAS